MAHLLYELTQVVPGLVVKGIDISQYALEHAKEEVRDKLQYGHDTKSMYDIYMASLIFS